jgi:hypothetical protein
MASVRGARQRSCLTQGVLSTSWIHAAEQDREALGRSRGGVTTKIHLVADLRCRPLARLTSAGQRHDSLAFVPVLGQLAIRRRGPGRPRTRPNRVLADKAYSNKPVIRTPPVGAPRRECVLHLADPSHARADPRSDCSRSHS